jgi:hypothetical protein
MEKNKRRAEIYSKNRFGEYTVKFFIKGTRVKNADYCTDCLDDADETASAFLNTQKNLTKIKKLLEGGK